MVIGVRVTTDLDPILVTIAAIVTMVDGMPCFLKQEEVEEEVADPVVEMEVDQEVREE